MSRGAVLQVLETAANHTDFYTQLAEDPQVALKDFDLTSEEKAALISGDVRFIESRIGKKLDGKLMEKVITPLLSRERW
ncbi:hypothetical protein ES708_29654 [subsurface metagenome]